MLMAEALWSSLIEVFNQMSKEVVYLVPKILTVLAIIVITLLAIKMMNIFLQKLLGFVELDRMIYRLTGTSLPFSLNNLIIFLADLGISLIALYMIADFLLGAQYTQLVAEGLHYGARIISVIVVIIIIFATFSAITGKAKVEARLRSYVLFVILLLLTAMLVDMTALSEPVKGALTTGLSIGVGISIGVFAVWFFFRDYLDKLLATRPSQGRVEKEQEGRG